jgi:hypothetical protein
MPLTHIYSELNTAILRVALAHVATRNYKELAELGLTPEIIDELREFRAEDFVMLSSYSPRASCLRSGVIDAKQILHLVRSVKDRRREEEMILEFVRLRAPRTLMRDLFGISADDYCHYRRQVGLNGEGVGRPELPDDDTQALVWKAWQATKDLPEKERYLRLARDTGVPLNSALRALKHCEPSTHKDRYRKSA